MRRKNPDSFTQRAIKAGVYTSTLIYRSSQECRDKRSKKYKEYYKKNKAKLLKKMAKYRARKKNESSK